MTWTLTLNVVDGDCETLPGRYATEAEAKADGEAWVAGTLFSDMLGGECNADEERTYWTTRQ